MKFYELTYLISPDLEEEKLKALQEKINAFIQEESGFLNETGNLIQKKLAFPIKKKSQAIFATINFQLLSEKLEGLEKKLKSEDGVLRYLILTKKTVKKIPRFPIKPPTMIKPLSKVTATKPKKVELKDIEKKLEDILKE